MRRILVVSAEFEGKPHGGQLTDFLLQLGALAGLAFVLALSIYLLRRSDSNRPAQSPGR